MGFTLLDKEAVEMCFQQDLEMGAQVRKDTDRSVPVTMPHLGDQVDQSDYRISCFSIEGKRVTVRTDR